MYIFVAIPGDLVCYIHYTQLRLGSFQILSDYMWLKSPVSDCVVKAHWKISEVAGKTCSQLYLLQTLNILIYSYYLFLPICDGVHGLVLYIRVYHLLHGWFGYLVDLEDHGPPGKRSGMRPWVGPGCVVVAWLSGSYSNSMAICSLPIKCKS